VGAIKLLSSLVMLGLFAVAIITFAIGFASDNDAAISLADDPELSSFQIDNSGNISDLVDGGAEDTYKSIIDTAISPDAGTAQSVGPFAISWINAKNVVQNIMMVGYTKIFGGGSGYGMFLTALIGLISIIGILYGYKALRGLPD